MTDLHIIGKPVARFRFRFIPSWNDVFGKGHWRNAHKVTKAWRLKGEKLALKLMGQLGPQMKQDYLINRRALVVVRVIRGNEKRYDVHNVWLKALLDGFSDGRIWPDDEWPYVPVVVAMWSHDYEGRGQRFEIEIHELGDVWVNGNVQVMPEGRGQRAR